MADNAEEEAGPPPPEEVPPETPAGEEEGTVPPAEADAAPPAEADAATEGETPAESEATAPTTTEGEEGAPEGTSGTGAGEAPSVSTEGVGEEEEMGEEEGEEGESETEGGETAAAEGADETQEDEEGERDLLSEEEEEEEEEKLSEEVSEEGQEEEAEEVKEEQEVEEGKEEAEKAPVEEAEKPAVKEEPRPTPEIPSRLDMVTSSTQQMAVRSEPSVSAVGDAESWTAPKQMIRPDDQLDLNDELLKEDITVMLMQVNPRVPMSEVEYSFKEGGFVRIPFLGHTVITYSMEPTCLRKDTEEARNQILAELGEIPEDFMPMDMDSMMEARGEEEDMEEEPPPPPPPPIEEEVEEEEELEENVDEEELEDEMTVAEGEGGKEEPDDEEAGPAKPKKVMNQFNFCERAALTYTYPCRDMTVQTLEPVRGRLSGQVYQFLIYDAYQADIALQQQLKEKKEHPTATEEVKEKGKTTDDVDMELRMLTATKTLERMINLNTYDEVAQDYRYWEDLSDTYVDGSGSLLPLWKFTCEKTKKKSVTGLCWNPCYYDLFAVTFGSYQFMCPEKEGSVALYTLKNPSYPEYLRETSYGAMCVDVHYECPYLMAVGLYDGSVCVYDTQQDRPDPAYLAADFNDKHTSVPWQVKWGPNTSDGDLNFFSIGADGVVCRWTLENTSLAMVRVLTIITHPETVPGPDGMKASAVASATSFCFHPLDKSLMLVGTEDGEVHKCSTVHTCTLLRSYNTHYMPVLRISYNKYNTQIFITCSIDKTIKMWDEDQDDPIFVFDLGFPVMDVAWAPYSSTVFAALTLNGIVAVYDININKYQPLCWQQVVSRKRYKLTKLAFNLRMPIIIVGDDKGNVTTLKLSPNLRKKVRPSKKGPPKTPLQLEVEKLDRILMYVREPAVLVRPPDIPKKY